MSKWLPENYRGGFNKNETLIIKEVSKKVKPPNQNYVHNG